MSNSRSTLLLRNLSALRVRPAISRGFGSCREIMVRARAKNVNRIRFWNPFIPGIRFTVGTGFQITVGHERRHLLQAERVLHSPSFPQQFR